MPTDQRRFTIRLRRRCQALRAWRPRGNAAASGRSGGDLALRLRVRLKSGLDGRLARAFGEGSSAPLRRVAPDTCTTRPDARDDPPRLRSKPPPTLPLAALLKGVDSVSRPIEG